MSTLLIIGIIIALILSFMNLVMLCAGWEVERDGDRKQADSFYNFSFRFGYLAVLWWILVAIILVGEAIIDKL